MRIPKYRAGVGARSATPMPNDHRLLWTMVAMGVYRPGTLLHRDTSEDIAQDVANPLPVRRGLWCDCDLVQRVPSETFHLLAVLDRFSEEREVLHPKDGGLRALGLQNAMTSSERAHVSRSRGLPHREGNDGLRRPPPF